MTTSSGDNDQLGFVAKRLLKHFRGHTTRVMETTVNTASTFMGVSVNIHDYVARGIVEKGGTHLLSMDIEGQTRKALFKGLAESRAAGYHPSSAATRKLIQEHVTAGRFTKMVDRHGKPNGHIYRAKLIARTETMHAQNESAMATYEASDAVVQGEIVDNQTGFGDADCMARNGFIGSLDECRRHIAAEHPQGTARVLPVLKDDVIEKPTVAEEVRGTDITRDKEGTWSEERAKHQEMHDTDPDGIPDPRPDRSNYWGNDYEAFNENLRDGLPLSEDQEKMASDLRDLMTPSTEPKITYRGVKGFRGDLTPGNVLSFREPLSTSYNPWAARSFRGPALEEDAVLFMVHIPKGTRSIVTNSVEQEVTLDFGTQWRVIKDHWGPSRRWGHSTVVGRERIVEVEVIQ